MDSEQALNPPWWTCKYDLASVSLDVLTCPLCGRPREFAEMTEADRTGSWTFTINAAIVSATYSGESR